MKHFVNDDAGYDRWLKENPGGYVVNTYDRPSPGCLVLHRATCGRVGAGGKGRGSFTSKQYSKVCSTRRKKLEAWAINLGGELKHSCSCLQDTGRSKVVAIDDPPARAAERAGLVEAYLLKCAEDGFDRPIYRNTDSVVGSVFAYCPTNDQPVAVLHKVVVLNALYRTNVMAIFKVAGYIQAKGRELDELLAAGSAEAVKLLRRPGIRNRRGNIVDFYSFATKYCHWHRPDRYPMYDRYVDVAIRRIARFIHGRPEHPIDLRDYPAFKKAIDDVMVWTDWPPQAYKRLDQGLWILGQILTGELRPTDVGIDARPPEGL